MYLYLLTLHSERTTSDSDLSAMKGDRIIPLPAAGADRPIPFPTRKGIDDSIAPSTKWHIGTQEQQNLQLRRQPHVHERNRYDIHGYRFVKMEQDINPTELEAALNIYYTKIICTSIPNCTRSTRLKVSKFVLPNCNEIPSELSAAFGTGATLALESPLTTQGTFNSSYSECKLTNDRMDAIVKYIESYIDMMNMRAKIIEAPVPVEATCAVEELAGFEDIANNAMFKCDAATYEGPEVEKKPVVSEMKEKLVYVKWNPEKDIISSNPVEQAAKPGLITRALDTVFGLIMPKLANTGTASTEKAAVEKEFYLMPCALTKYLGTDFCPEFHVTTPEGNTCALTALYSAMTSAVPKFNRALLNAAVEAMVVEEAIEEAEADKKSESEEQAEEVEETEEECEESKNSEDAPTRVSEWNSSSLEPLLNSEGQRVDPASAEGIRLAYKLKMEQKDKPNPERIKEINTMIKKTSELCNEYKELTTSAESHPGAKKILQEKGGKILSELANLSVIPKRTPQREVFEQLWMYFTGEFVYAYEPNSYSEPTQDRLACVRAAWLMMTLRPKSTPLSKNDVYGATYMGNKTALPEGYISETLFADASSFFDDMVKKLSQQKKWMRMTMLGFELTHGLGHWRDPKMSTNYSIGFAQESVDLDAAVAYVKFAAMPARLTEAEKELAVAAFARSSTKADLAETVGSQQMYQHFQEWLSNYCRFDLTQIKTIKSIIPIGELSRLMKAIGYAMTRRATGMVYLKTALVENSQKQIEKASAHASDPVNQYVPYNGLGGLDSMAASTEADYAACI